MSSVTQPPPTENFAVSGTAFPLLPIPPQPIDPYENDGVFTVAYEIDAKGTVDIELSVTDAGQTPLICGSEATEFYDQACGERVLQAKRRDQLPII